MKKALGLCLLFFKVECNSLIKAIRERNLNGVKIAIQNGEDVNKLYRGKLPLVNAINHSSGNIFHFLLSLPNINVNLKDSFKETPLHAAVESDSSEMTLALLKKGARLEEKNDINFTPLQSAVLNGYLHPLGWLKLHGGNVNILTPNNETLLHLANTRDEFGEKKDPFLINQLLLAWELDPDILDSDGNNALHLAAENQYSQSMAVLLADRANYLQRNNLGQLPVDFTIPESQEYKILNTHVPYDHPDVESYHKELYSFRFYKKTRMQSMAKYLRLRELGIKKETNRFKRKK